MITLLQFFFSFKSLLRKTTNVPLHDIDFSVEKTDKTKTQGPTNAVRRMRLDSIEKYSTTDKTSVVSTGAFNWL